jgi:hypothetical protein
MSSSALFAAVHPRSFTQIKLHKTKKAAVITFSANGFNWNFLVIEAQNVARFWGVMMPPFHQMTVYFRKPSPFLLYMVMLWSEFQKRVNDIYTANNHNSDATHANMIVTHD